MVLWFVVFAKVGSGLVFGIGELLRRVQVFPRLVISGEALSDYRNWAVLPLALGRLVGADTARSFAGLQAVLLVVGTVGVLATVARRRPEVACGAVVGLFATMVPSWLLYSMGSYDQLLVVLLLAMTLADARATSSVCGLLLGLTHAEAAVTGLIGLGALSHVGVGPPPKPRYWGLGGVLVSRVALTVWFRIAGQSGDRFTFVSEFGLGKLLGFFADTWPCILWSAAAGGWLIIASRFTVFREKRVMQVIAAVLVFNLLVSAVTADQSRVVMIITLPLVVALAAFPPDTPVPTTPARLPALVNGAALMIGLLAPLTISWVGEIAIAGRPFDLRW